MMDVSELHRRKIPTEFVDGRWIHPSPSGPEPDAVVTYTTVPSPETGHVGWCWWARGRMGDAQSYEDAKRAAEAALRRSPHSTSPPEEQAGPDASVCDACGMRRVHQYAQVCTGCGSPAEPPRRGEGE